MTTRKNDKELPYIFFFFERSARVDRIISHDVPGSDEGSFAENKRRKQGCNESQSDL